MVTLSTEIIAIISLKNDYKNIPVSIADFKKQIKLKYFLCKTVIQCFTIDF